MRQGISAATRAGQLRTTMSGSTLKGTSRSWSAAVVYLAEQAGLRRWPSAPGIPSLEAQEKRVPRELGRVSQACPGGYAAQAPRCLRVQVSLTAQDFTKRRARLSANPPVIVSAIGSTLERLNSATRWGCT